MEYQRIMNLLDNTPNEPTKFWAKKWVEIKTEEHGTYSTNSQIKFETSVLRSTLCDFSEAHILVIGVVQMLIVAALAAGRGNNVIEVAFKNCSSFTNCISKINNSK